MMPKQKLPQSAPVTGGDATGLRIEALSVVRGQRLVIDRLNHAQTAGAYCLLTGANGAGKSTLLRTIAGRLPAESGHIHCDMPRIYIGHADGLAGAISGRKNLRSWSLIRRWTDLTRAHLPICQSSYCRVANAAGWRWRDCCWRHRTACGCWTNQMPGLT